MTGMVIAGMARAGMVIAGMVIASMVIAAMAIAGTVTAGTAVAGPDAAAEASVRFCCAFIELASVWTRPDALMLVEFNLHHLSSIADCG